MQVRDLRQTPNNKSLSQFGILLSCAGGVCPLNENEQPKSMSYMEWICCHKVEVAIGGALLIGAGLLLYWYFTQGPSGGGAGAGATTGPEELIPGPEALISGSEELTDDYKTKYLDLILENNFSVPEMIGSIRAEFYIMKLEMKILANYNYGDACEAQLRSLLAKLEVLIEQAQNPASGIALYQEISDLVVLLFG